LSRLYQPGTDGDGKGNGRVAAGVRLTRLKNKSPPFFLYVLGEYVVFVEYRETSEKQK